MRYTFVILIIGLLALTACGTDAQLANPASKNCVDQGGELEIRNTAEGQVGVCHINGAECEEWALFRGEGCVTLGAEVNNESNGELNDDFVACEDPRPEACTREYMPVCAQVDTGIRCITTPCPSTEEKTYSTGCTACSDPDVYGYVPGECQTDALPELSAPPEEQQMAVCTNAPEWMDESWFNCVDACPEGYDSYMSQIAVEVCVERMDKDTFSSAVVCDKRVDYAEGQSCVLADKTTSGEEITWTTHDDAFRCLPQEYVNYRLHTNGATVLDEKGNEATMIA